MKLALLLCPGAALDPRVLLPGGQRAAPRLVTPGFPPQAAALALLGQDLSQAWTGPAAFAAAAAGWHLVEDETAYLLDPVRVEGERIVSGPEPLGPARLAEVLGLVAASLEGEPVQLGQGERAVLVLGEPCSGPAAQVEEPLAGRTLEQLPAGPPALLRRVIVASRAALAEKGRAGQALFPHSPGGPVEATPLREAWPGLGPATVVGSGPVARALAQLLALTHVPARPGEELARAKDEAGRADALVVVCERTPAALDELRALGPRVLAVAGDPDPEGRVPLAWEGPPGPLGAGPELWLPLWREPA